MKKLFFVLTVIFTIHSFNCSSQVIIKTCVIKLPNCQLFENPGSHPLAKIPKGKKVDVMEVIDGYYKVKYAEQTGYILDLFIHDPVLNELKDKIKAENHIKEQEAMEQEEKLKQENRLKREKYLIENYGEFHAICIKAHKVVIGMTKEEVRESWGNPDDINKTTLSNYVNEQWVYKGSNYKDRYLYFSNGVLETIQE